VFEGRGCHQVQIVGGRLTLRAGTHRKLTAVLNRRGKQLASARLRVTADVSVSAAATRRVQVHKTARLVPSSQQSNGT